MPTELHTHKKHATHCADNVDVKFKSGMHTYTQKVLELPSTAMFAPCAVASAELLALIAPRAATSSSPAVKPF